MQQTGLDIKVDKLFKFISEKPLKAFVDITINDVLLIKGMRVVEGPEGLFVSMPRQQGRNDKWYDRVKCLTNEVREQITYEVMRVYHNDDR